MMLNNFRKKKSSANSNTPLLITSAINVSAPFTNLEDPSLRVKLLIESLKKWVNHYPHISIVICDGSGYDLESNDYIATLLEKDSRIEVLSFKNNQSKVTELGKGYGEGEIIKYALTHSVKLSGAVNFAKITGRLFCYNYERYLNKSLNFDFSGTVHVKYSFKLFPHIERSIDTRFFIVKKKFYERFLIDAYLEVNDRHGLYLEHAFFTKLVTANQLGGIVNIFENFYIEGRSGSKNTDYTKPDILKKILQAIRWTTAKWIIKATSIWS